MFELEAKIKTPCIGVCSTGIGDSVCRGCKRFAHEVIDWNSYNQRQKKIIDQRLEHFLTIVTQSKLRIVDDELLRWQIETQQIRVVAYRNSYNWLFELLRAGAKQITNPLEFGFEVLPEFKDCTLHEIKNIIEQEFYLLSEAHYQRYFSQSKQLEQ